MADVLSPFYLAPSDSPGATLVSSILIGDNYGTLAKETRRALRLKNKLGFIDASLEKPNPLSSEFDLWDIGNSMIISWILNSLEKNLRTSLEICAGIVLTLAGSAIVLSSSSDKASRIFWSHKIQRNIGKDIKVGQVVPRFA